MEFNFRVLFRVPFFTTTAAATAHSSHSARSQFRSIAAQFELNRGLGVCVCFGVLSDLFAGRTATEVHGATPKRDRR